MLLAIALPILAVAAPEWDCWGIELGRTTGPVRLAQVTADKAFFGGPDNAFPQSPRSYVVRGDVVIVAPGWHRQVPAFYPKGKGSGRGCLHETRIRYLPAAPAPRLRDWQGAWKKIGPPPYGNRNLADDEITVRVRGKGLAITGNAYWYYSPNGANFGGIDARGTPSGDVLAIDTSDMPDRVSCPIRMQRIGDFLVVADENRCNGQNASFSGVYRR